MSFACGSRPSRTRSRKPPYPMTFRPVGHSPMGTNTVASTSSASPSSANSVMVVRTSRPGVGPSACRIVIVSPSPAGRPASSAISGAITEYSAPVSNRQRKGSSRPTTATRTRTRAERPSDADGESLNAARPVLNRAVPIISIPMVNRCSAGEVCVTTGLRREPFAILSASERKPPTCFHLWPPSARCALARAPSATRTPQLCQRRFGGMVACMAAVTVS